jgi:methyltransferase (TIGR00027 family)
MELGRPSTTAQRAALLRAVHQLLDDPVIFADPIAGRLIGPEHAARLQGDLSDFERPDLRRLRASIAVRSRFAEDALGEAVRRGVRQYVVLGAGLDSLAYRNPFTGLRVFEVDHPDTQQWKRHRLREAGIAIPESLTFVPVDFERQSLIEAFADGGIDTAQPAFVSWLGVTMYLTPDAVLRTLAELSTLGAGSEVVFEYVIAPDRLPETSRSAVIALAARAAAAGEPWLAFFEPAQLTRALADFGFEPVEDFGPAQTFDRYFQGRPDGLRSGSASHLVIARIPLQNR